MNAAGDLLEQCRACWVRRRVTSPHATYRCNTNICSGTDWKNFKSSLRFPPNVVCFFCLATYGPPFNHDKSLGSGDFCEYRDVLKELSFILFKEDRVRMAIFRQLGTQAPANLQLYKRYIAKRGVDGSLGVHEVLATYLDLREAGIV
jgi:hypothetical protein